jgi:anti-sigma28 factor (negative regulator of flagellin synthesis)
LGISGASAQEVVGSMEITTGNDSYPRSGPIPENEAVLPHVQDEHHASEPTGAGKRLDLSMRVMDELTRRLVSVSEARESKIRALRDAIKNDTYQVTAEQIADKMLRCTLEEELT